MESFHSKRRRQRIGAAIGLAVATLLALSRKHDQLLLRHRGESLAQDKKLSNWTFLRRLNPLSRDQVNSIIFERHDEPYPEKSADDTPAPRDTLAPTPSQGTSAPSPTTTVSAPTSSPTPISETVVEFITRTLTDDGSLTTVGTPQNLALGYFTSNYPAITQVNSETVQELVSTAYSLAVLYYSTRGDEWRDNTSWVGSAPPCGIQGSAPWFGITCTSSVVESLTLPENDLVGQLPSELRGLTGLQNIVLNGNSLSGNLPATISELANLTTLDLGENFIAGTIPPSIGSASNLMTLSLQFNQINGPIAPEINRLVNLRTLNLNGNMLTGAIPPLSIPTLRKFQKTSDQTWTTTVSCSNPYYDA
eukprot:scaffold4269_cov168-Amphora_coffeaeformis.AAC.1